MDLHIFANIIHPTKKIMHKIYSRLLLSLCFFIVTVAANAQTTYTWATPGTGGAWTTAANWAPNGVPGAGDNVIINQTATIAITAVPTGITLSSISNTPTTSSTLTFQSAAAGTLSVNTVNVTGTASISPTLAIGSTFALVIAIPTAGNFNLNTNSSVTSTSTNLTFASGATLNYARDGGSIPSGAYNANSTINITGIIAASLISAPATIGNLIWNCAGQANILTSMPSVTAVTGSATITNTGSTVGSFQWALAVTITGAYTINNGAIVNSSGASITCNGGLILNSGGSIQGATATTYTLNTGSNLILNTGGFVTGATIQTFIMNGTGAQGATCNALISGLVNLTVAATSVTTLNSSVLLNALTISGGGSLITSAGQTVTVNAAATLGSAATNGTLSGAGNFIITGNGSLVINGTGPAIQSGSNALATSGTVSVLSGNITLSGTAAQTFGSNFPTGLIAGTVTINNAAGVTIDKTVSINAFTITAGTTTINAANVLTVNGTSTLPGTAGILVVNGTFTQAAGTISFQAPTTTTGTGTFNLSSGATLATSNLLGIAATGSTGSVLTNTRNFDPNANYTFTGGATGNGMPATVNGIVSISSIACTIGSSYIFSGQFSSTVNVTITAPNAVTIGATGTATHATGTTVTGTGTYSTLTGATLVVATASTTGGLFSTPAAASGLFQITTLTISTGTNVNYNGTTLNVPLGISCPSTLGSITVSSTGSLSLAAPLSVTNLSFTGAGFINTTSAFLLSVTGTAANAVNRPSTGYVVGPLARILPPGYNSGNTFLFPVGKTVYQGFEVVNPTTDGSGAITLQLESFATAPTGGTSGTGLTGALTSRYWQVSLSGPGNLTSVSNVRVNDAGLLATQKIGQSATAGGAYNSIGGTYVAGASLLSGLPVNTFTGGTFFSVATGTSSGTFAAGTYSVGPSGTYGLGYAGNYFSITSALAAMAENAVLGGAVTLELQADYSSTVEAYPLNFSSSVPTTTLNTVTIRPASVVGSVINFNPAGGIPSTIFDMNGGKNFIIDGRNGGIGTNQFIGINNLGNGSALRYINDAQNNIYKYVSFTSSNTSVTSGVILFSTTTGAGAGNGNNNNTIDNCNINGSGVSPYGIYALGTASPADNKANTITNCKIFDYYSSTSAIGIYVSTNNTGWNIGTAGNGNSLYQTSVRVPTTTGIGMYGILVSNTTGNGYTVRDNVIGGNIPGIPSSVFTLGSNTQTNNIANFIYGIRMNVGATTLSTVQTNTIANINIYSSSSSASALYFAGIFASAGNVDIIGNTIGSTSSNGSINFSWRGTGTFSPSINGINTQGSYTGGNITFNNIGGITTSSDFAGTNAIGFTGITYGATATTFASNISKNLIGSNTIANSIEHLSAAQNPATQIGISFATTTLGSTGATVQNNTIANLTNSTAFSYSNNFLSGIISSGSALVGSLVIASNTIRDLKTSSTNPTLASNVSSIVGLSVLSSVTSSVSAYGAVNVANNKLFNFTNTTSTPSAVSIVGMFFNAAANGGNIIERNIIHGFSTNNNNTVAGHYGMIISTSSSTATACRNNMLRLGINPDGTSNTASTIMFGIYKLNTNVHYIHFNSVYVGGSSVTGGNVNTAAFYKASTSGADEIKDNIFMNARSNASGAAKHYAIELNTINSIISNNNDLFVNGTGGILGTTGSGDYATLTAWKGATNLDLSSVSGDPKYINPAGTSTNLDLHINASVATPVESAGVDIAGSTNDYDNENRSSLTPVDIGADAGNFIAQDLTPPAISFTAIGNSYCASNRVLNAFATITDVISGVNTTSGTKPRLYYKKSVDANNFVGNTSGDNGWKFVEASNATSPFNFTIDYTLLQAVPVTNDVIQYFVVAQDNAPTPNVSMYSGLFTATPISVALTSAAFPITGTISSYTITAAAGAQFSGTVNVGTGQTYASLTGTAGLFAAINGGSLSANTTVVLMDPSITETGVVALNTINYGCGTYTLTIKPNTSTILTGSVASGATIPALIKLNGASNVIFDGSNNGSNSRNLNIINSSTTSTTGNAVIWLAAPTAGNGSNNNTIKNCIIEGSTFATTSTAFMGIYIGGATNTSLTITTAGNENNNGNIISNNLFRKTQYGLVMFAYNQFSPDSNNVVTNNNFGAAAATDGLYTEGIHTDREKNLLVSGNEIQNIRGSGSNAMFGINLRDFKNGKAFNNLVHNISYSGTSAVPVVGINASSSSYVTANNPSQGLIYNNAVYDLTSTSTSTTWNTTGILANSGYGDRYYFNTVNLGGQLDNATGSVAAFANGNGTSIAYNSAIDVRDNIFSVTGSTASSNVYAYYSKAPNFNGVTQNNNLLYANATGSVNYVGSFNALNYATLAAWQTASGVDANSISADPLINSNTNPQTQPGSPATGAGTAIGGITTDITGVTRNTPPTIGAYEQSIDLTGPVITYTPLSGTLCTTNRTFTAAVTDLSGVNITPGTKPRIYFKKSTSLNVLPATNDNSTDGWKYTEATNASSPFSFTLDYTLINGGVVAGTIIQYFITAQDLAATPNVGVNAGTFAAPQTSASLSASAFPIGGTINSYTISAGTALSTDVTIGATGTYTSLTGLTGLFAALNGGGLTNNITARIMDASVTETGVTALNAINYGCAGIYTLTIKPNTTNTLTGSVSPGALLKINGASNIIIDGSNSGGNDQSLTITNINTGAPTAISLISPGLGLGSKNFTIKNCAISTGLSSSLGYGISVGGSTSGTSGADNDNITIQNNSITSASIGIYANGTASLSAGGLDNLLISGNTIIANSGTLQNYGIEVGNALNSSITGNTISEQTTSSSQPVGISIETGFVSSSVTKNYILKVATTSTGGYGGRGITVGTGTATSNLLIANNSVSGVNGSNYSSFTNSSSMGIGIGMVGGSSTLTTATGGVNLYYNSVNMFGPYSYTVNCITTALYIGTGATALDIRNNVFVNSLNNTNGSAPQSRNYAIFSAATSNSVFSNSNYNDYYVTAPQGILGSYNLSDQNALAGLRSASGQDVNSISADPLYNTTSNLQPQSGSPLVAAGITLPSVTSDITGFTRGNPSTIGAYEQVGNFSAPTITYTPLSGTLCNTNRTFSATITSPVGINTTTGTRPRIYFKKSTNANSLGATNDNASDGWKYTEASNTTSPYNLTIDYSLVSGGVIAGSVLQYFVVAQDINAIPNVGINNGTFAAIPTSVALTASAFPIGGTINSYSILTGGIAGPVTVGAGGTYPTLTGAGGLFSTINGGGLTANVTATINSSITTEDGSVALNPVSYGCGANATLTIVPSGVFTISGSVASGALIKLNGASNVTIDGSLSGGTDRSLTITNTNTNSPAAIWLANSASGIGSSNDIIKNCNISTGTNSATSYGIIGGGTTIGTAGPDVDNITIQNNSITQVYYGIYGNGTAAVSAGGFDNWVITNNLIGPAVSGANNIGFAGIWMANALNLTITGDSIRNLSTSTTNAAGINLNSNVNRFNIAQNTIRDITSSAGGSGISSNAALFLGTAVINGSASKNIIRSISNTNTGGYGVRAVIINTSTVASNDTLSNNTISDVYNLADVLSNYWPIGIDIDGASGGINLYYNSVNLFGAHSGYSTGNTAAAALFLNTTTTGTLDIRNNVFSDSYDNTTSTSDKAYSIYSTGTISSQFNPIDYNDYFVSGPGGPVLGFLSTDRLTLADIQAGFGGNINSKTGDPLYNSANNLQPQSGSPIVGAGVNITSITTDINGVTRGNPSSIGAFEQAGNFTLPVINYTTLTNTLCGNNRTLSVTITSGVGINNTPGTRPRVYYKKTTNANNVFATNDNTTDGWKYAESTNGASPYNFVIDYTKVFGGVATGETVQYFVIAQDVNPTPNVGINSGIFAATPTSVTLTAAAFPISGTINQYQIVSGGLSGSVNVGTGQTYTTLTGAGGLFSAINATGLTGNLVANIMSNVTETGAIVLNKIGYGCSGTSSLLIKPSGAFTLTGSTASALVSINGASNVTIDGSTSGGTDKSLTVANTNTASGSAIAIMSLGTGSGAANNTIKNCIISTGTTTSTGYGISIGGATLGTTGADNDNVTIQNNTINNATVGIYAQGTSSVTIGGLDNLVLSGNSINSLTSTLQVFGIQVGNALNATVSGNQVAVQTSAGASPVGISIETGFVSSVVSKNVVSKVSTSSTIGYGGRGITIGTGTATSNLTVSNNVVYGVNGSNYSSFSNSSSMGIGVGVLGGSITLTTITGGVNLYYNSVNMFGPYTSTYSNIITTALYVGSGATALDIRDNVLVNSLNYTGIGTTPKNYAFYSDATNAAFANINFNDYYVSGSQGVLAYLGSDQVTIAALRTATGKDVNSISGDPMYTANNYLQPLPGSPVLASGVAIAGFTDDINGDSRNPVPTIGAYEKAHPGICPASSTSFTSDATGATYQWYVDDGSGGGYVSIANNAVYGGATNATLSITNPPTSYNGYKYRALVNGTTFSSVYTLKIVVVWTGAVSTDWLNIGNWSCGVVPDGNTDVQINAQVPFYPIVTANVSCKSLTLKPTAVVNVAAGFSINITGHN